MVMEGGGRPGMKDVESKQEKEPGLLSAGFQRFSNRELFK
jgi:hypothetical protein